MSGPVSFLLSENWTYTAVLVTYLVPMYAESIFLSLRFWQILINKTAVREPMSVWVGLEMGEMGGAGRDDFQIIYHTCIVGFFCGKVPPPPPHPTHPPKKITGRRTSGQAFKTTRYSGGKKLFIKSSVSIILCG